MKYVLVVWFSVLIGMLIGILIGEKTGQIQVLSQSNIRYELRTNEDLTVEWKRINKK